MKRLLKISIMLQILALLSVNSFYGASRDSIIGKRFLKKGWALYKDNSLFRAYRYFERASRKFIRAKDFAGVFEAYKGMGDVNMKKGYLDRAFDMYVRARYYAYKGNSTGNLMFVDLCRNVAHVHASHKYWANAVAWMKTAVSLGARLGDPRQGYNVSYLAKLQALLKKEGAIGH